MVLIAGEKKEERRKKKEERNVVRVIKVKLSRSFKMMIIHTYTII